MSQSLTKFTGAALDLDRMIFYLASNDLDFDRVPAVQRYEP
jgi:hypothetical protein